MKNYRRFACLVAVLALLAGLFAIPCVAFADVSVYSHAGAASLDVRDSDSAAVTLSPGEKKRLNEQRSAGGCRNASARAAGLLVLIGLTFLLDEKH